jgi:hypothetical protein
LWSVLLSGFLPFRYWRRCIRWRMFFDKTSKFGALLRWTRKMLVTVCSNTAPRLFLVHLEPYPNLEVLQVWFLKFNFHIFRHQNNFLLKIFFTLVGQENNLLLVCHSLVVVVF